MHKPLAACLNATRAVFSVRGPDAAAFLQGYVTVNLLTHRQTGAYGALLNAQGRVLGDVFVYPEVDAGGGEPEYLIDCDFSLMDRLAKHLNMFKLRSKVKIAPAKDLYDVWALWSPDEAPPGPGPGGALGEAPQREEPVVWVQDTRGPCPGARLLLPCSRGLTGGDAQEVAAVDYHVHRISNGVPEGVADFKVAKSFPFESNLDYMRGVHFDKGCYLGQEPTARTFFRGATRKRLVPVQFYPSLDALEAASPEQKGVVVESGGAAPAPDTALRALGKGRSGGDRDGDGDGEGEGEGRAAGTVCSTVHNIGLALVRLPATGPMVAAREAGGEWYAKAFVPTWWEARGTGK